MKIAIENIKKLRTETRASIADCRKALEESGNDYKKALEWIKKHGIEKASKKSGRKTSQGLVEAYIHQGGKVGAMIELTCETDFVARTEMILKTLPMNLLCRLPQCRQKMSMPY